MEGPHSSRIHKKMKKTSTASSRADSYLGHTAIMIAEVGRWVDGSKTRKR
jgi:hypothetical protein